MRLILTALFFFVGLGAFADTDENVHISYQLKFVGKNICEDAKIIPLNKENIICETINSENNNKVVFKARVESLPNNTYKVSGHIEETDTNDVVKPVTEPGIITHSGISTKISQEMSGVETVNLTVTINPVF